MITSRLPAYITSRRCMRATPPDPAARVFLANNKDPYRRLSNDTHSRDLKSITMGMLQIAQALGPDGRWWRGYGSTYFMGKMAGATFGTAQRAAARQRAGIMAVRASVSPANVMYARIL